MSRFRHLHFIGLLLLFSYVVFMWGNGALNLTDPDEVFYSQTAKEMSEHHTWMIPYLFDHPQFEKPVFTYWLLRVAFTLFGISNFSARFFPALFGMIGVLTVYLLAFLAFGEKKKAFICALVLLSSGLYIGLARTVFTDMIFSVFILLSLAAFFWGYLRRRRKTAGILLFFIFSAFAVLTKGPLGFIIPAGAVALFLLIKREWRFFFTGASLWGIALFLAIGLPWYLFMMKTYGSSFIREFFYNDHLRRIFEAEHAGNDRWYFYPVSMFACMFPWSLYTAAALGFLIKRLSAKAVPDAPVFLACWIIACFSILQIAHSKLVSYIFPLFPALAMLTGDFIHRGTSVSGAPQRRMVILAFLSWAVFLCMPAALIVATARYAKYFSSKIGVYEFVVFYILILAVMFFCILRRRLTAHVYLLSCQVPLFLFFALASHKSFDAYVSSKPAIEYLRPFQDTDTPLLCAKPFVRGVRFYSNRDVAVINHGATGFFSPHPIPYLNTDEKILTFLEQYARSPQPVFYGVLNKSSFSDLERVLTVRPSWTMQLLKMVGDKYLIRIDLAEKSRKKEE